MTGMTGVISTVGIFWARFPNVMTGLEDVDYLLICLLSKALKSCLPNNVSLRRGKPSAGCAGLLG